MQPDNFPTPVVTRDPLARDVAEQFETGGWEFTPAVAEVFDEHVRASVPHYDIIQAIVADLSDWLLPDNGLIADLGASTGTTVANLIARHPERHLRAALYDESSPMLAKAVDRLTQPVALGDVKIHTQRIQAPLKHLNADLTTCLFTLQFLPYGERQHVLEQAWERSAPTGALIIAEKVRPVDARWAEIAHAVSHDWKAEHGIDAAAIRAKERALRGVLMPQSPAGLLAMISGAGWHQPEVLFRWHQWMLVAAYAGPQT